MTAGSVLPTAHATAIPCAAGFKAVKVIATAAAVVGIPQPAF